MNVLVLNPGEIIPREKSLTSKDNITLDLEDMQEIVNGRIEIPYISEELYKKKIDMVVNEEGKIANLENSLFILDKNNKILDIIAGSILFCGVGEEGTSICLTYEQIKFIKKSINEHSKVNVDGEIKNYYLPSLLV